VTFYVKSIDGLLGELNQAVNDFKQPDEVRTPLEFQKSRHTTHNDDVDIPPDSEPAYLPVLFEK